MTKKLKFIIKICCWVIAFIVFLCLFVVLLVSFFTFSMNLSMCNNMENELQNSSLKFEAQKWNIINRNRIEMYNDLVNNHLNMKFKFKDVEELLGKPSVLREYNKLFYRKICKQYYLGLNASIGSAHLYMIVCPDINSVIAYEQKLIKQVISMRLQKATSQTPEEPSQEMLSQPLEESVNTVGAVSEENQDLW